MVDFNKNIKAKILCVDDDQTSILICRKFLSQPCFEVKTALSGEDGLKIAREFIPDIIVSDVVMPGMDGLEFCRRARNETTLLTSVFLLMSSQKTEVEDAVDALEGGADDYLVKPLNKDEFVAKIKAFLRIKRLQDSLMETNQKLGKAVQSLNEYKLRLEEKNEELAQDKKILENSLKQISLMARELETANNGLKELNKIREEALKNITNLLSTLIESRRQYHRGHAKNVAEISVYIAEKMGLSDNETRDIKIASLLHEIGKFGISDELAMKNPKEHTEQERDILSQHPVTGASLLSEYPGFEGISHIIRHCHEWLDGTGVPDRLKGDDIPIGSRIITVANLYDNIVNRSRDGTVKKAFSLIEEGIGTRYDASVAHCLRRYSEEKQSGSDEKLKEMRIYELEPEMILASDLYTMKGMKLMNGGTVLTKESIGKIIRYNKIDPLEEKVFVK